MRRLTHIKIQILLVLLLSLSAFLVHSVSDRVKAQDTTPLSDACSVNAIQNYLRGKGSPLADVAGAFVSAGQRYNVDPRFIVGIANAESTLATRWGTCRPESHNAWGYLYKDTDGAYKCRHYNSWEEGIDAVTKHVGENYFQKYGQTTIPSFVIQPAGICTSHCWCASGCTDWIPNVSDAYSALGGDPDTTDLSFATCVLIDSLPPNMQKIGLQAGHGNGDPGSLSCDRQIREADITAAVAEKAANLLRNYGFQVDLFIGQDSAIVGYQADAFVSLHADHCPNPSNPSVPSGYKVTRYDGEAGSGLNGSGDLSDQLAQALWDEYGSVSGLPQDRSPGHFPPRMLRYYALQQIDSSTPGALIEMGWLSGDLRVLVNEQDKLAAGIANSIIRFLTSDTADQSTQTVTTLLLDISGSMGDSWQAGIKLESAKEAAIKVVNITEQDSQLPGTTALDQVGVTTFASGAWLNFDLSPDYDQARASIAQLAPGGGTNMGQGLEIANQVLRSAPLDSKKFIFLLSDGLTNEGMSPDQILTGPVQEAIDAGVCIHTVGFGNKGELDEALLEEIAHRTGCEYSYADITQLEQGLLVLENTFIRDRHASVRTILTQFGGDVNQGETTPPQTFEVPTNHDFLVGTLNWPGSRLDLILTDPNGRLVDESQPDVQTAVFNGLLYIAVENPTPGTWQASVFGQDVPEGVTPYNVIFSAREALIIPTPVPEPTEEPAAVPAPPTPEPVEPEPVIEPGSGLTFVLFIVVLLGAVGGATFFALRNRRAAVSQAGLRLLTGQASPAWAGFRQGQLRLGRGRDNELVISDKDASRHHARIVQISQGYLLEDLDSTNGTYVNGERVERRMLHAGDLVQIGHTQFRFEVGAQSGSFKGE